MDEKITKLADANRILDSRLYAVLSSLCSLLGSCAALFLILTYQRDQIYGDMLLIWFIIPLALAALLITFAAANFVFRLSRQMQGSRISFFLALLALLPGIGFVIAMTLAHEVTGYLRDHGFHASMCQVCKRRFIGTDVSTGVCLNCLRSIR